MQLGVGDRALFEFPPLGDRFVGVVTECDLPEAMTAFVSAPANAAQRVQTGAPVLVMFAHEGRLLGFRAAIEKTQSGAGLVIRMRPDSEVEDVDLRCEPRAPCSFPADLENGSATFTGFVVDMSLTAARMRVQDPAGLPDSGSKATLRFSVFGSDDVYETPCRVFRSFLKENVPYVVLQYEGPDESFRRAVQEYIQHQSRSGGLNAV
ncbi:PilZ domain-containing protein [Salidesulfovibrio brasiliensis]|uniref:PilZ domain-containing protein n=1 Tax=Salidesulfovibrio brasiliensis TaxID=221711 RepID=UPI0006CFF731|nr:PilZ domain-containing protein [Salidesulfovibrio brasiliensis]